MRILLVAIIVVILQPVISKAQESGSSRIHLFDSFKQYTACELTRLSVLYSNSLGKEIKDSISKVCRDCKEPPMLTRLKDVLTQLNLEKNIRIIEEIEGMELPPEFSPLSKESLTSFFQKEFFKSGALGEFADDRAPDNGKLGYQSAYFENTKKNIESHIARLFPEASPDADDKKTDTLQNSGIGTSPQYTEPEVRQSKNRLTIWKVLEVFLGIIIILLNVFFWKELSKIKASVNSIEQSRQSPPPIAIKSLTISSLDGKLQELENEITNLKRKVEEIEENPQRLEETVGVKKTHTTDTDTTPETKNEVIYFGLPERSGSFPANEAYSSPSTDTIYEFRKISNNEATFRLIDNPRVYAKAWKHYPRALAPVTECKEGISRSSQSSGFRIISPGKAILRGGRWVVADKMVIELT